jgi:hypothetical protein
MFGRRTSAQSTLMNASYVSDNDHFPVFVATAGISKAFIKNTGTVYTKDKTVNIRIT